MTQGLALLLDLQGVNKKYGTIQALKDITASVPQGSIGLLGPNGAGKSTLLKILLGLTPASAGVAHVMEFDASTRSLELRQRLGYMPEGECYVAGLDAVEFCTYAGQLCGLPLSSARERAHAVLAYVGLEEKRYLKIETYSTGQKQRVKLAQALVHDPDLLLLDEPTNGLDPRGREEMLSLIRELPEKRGCSIILSSHLLQDVEEVCSQAMLLNQGQLLFSGAIAEMRGQKDNTYQVRVKEGMEQLSQTLKEQGCGVEITEGGLMVQLPLNKDPDMIFAAALKLEIQVRHLSPCRLSLESAFLRILEQGDR